MTLKSALYALCVGAILAFAANANAQTWKELQTSTDEAALIQAIEKPGDSPEDIHNKNVACKRLAVYGTPKAIPALVAMLSNDKLNFNARFALEAMPFEEVDAALLDAATKLDGMNLVGVVDTIGVRGKAGSVDTIKKILAESKDQRVKKAAFIALAAIGSPDAEAALVEAAQGDLTGYEFETKRGLGDATLALAQKYENAGKLAEASKLYKIVLNADYPKFERESGLYRSLLCDGAESAAKVVELIQGDDASACDIALKSLRAFAPKDCDAVVAKLLDAFDSLPVEKQVLVVRSFAQLKGEASRPAVAAKLAAIAKESDSVALQVAAAKTAKESVKTHKLPVAFSNDALKKSQDLRDAYAAYLTAEFKAEAPKFDPNAIVSDAGDEITLMNLKWIKDARVKAAGAKLVEIAETKTGAVRDAALDALSEIVELDDLDLLVQALNGETNDQKVDWLLRAACTRMPREECAAKVAELFEKADLDGKNKILPLLKQVGGSVALNAVANACNGPAIDKATQILGEWNTPEDAEQVAAICLAIAKQSTDAKYHSRGIRGYIRVARQFELPVDKKIEMCKIAFNTAQRAEDKKLIFEVFRRNIVAENVAAALEYADDPNFREDACASALFVAEKIRVSQPAWNWNEASGDAAKDAAAKILVDGMKKVADISKDADVKERAKKLL